MALDIYWLGLLLRVICMWFVDSYIHPDEHFQCGEVASALYLNNSQAHLPWEYAPQKLARSYLPVEIMCGIPFLALRAIKQSWNLSTDGWLEQKALRIWMFMLSLITDRVFASSALALGFDWHYALAVRSMSWVSILMSTRTFSNVLEGFYFDLLLFFATCIKKPMYQFFNVGFVAVMGCFARITFPAFGAPVVLYAIERLVSGIIKKREDHSLFWSLVSIIPYGLAAIVGGCLSGTLIVAWDSWRNGEFVIGPWVNLLYNTDSVNLAKHGLHPWYTHLLVNMQVMFAPMSLVALFSFRRRSRHMFLAWTVILPLVLLSCFPHQEFRFLYPMITPLALITTKYWDYKALRIIHIGFAIGFTVFFAFHQAQMTRSITKAGVFCSHPNTKQPCCVIACNVYMAPTYLLGDNSRLARIYDSTLMQPGIPSDCASTLIIEPESSPCNYPTNSSRARIMGAHWNSEAGGLTRLRISMAL